MKFFALLFALATVTTQVHAVQLIKCGSQEGKTLYASFGKRVTSGNPPITEYFPIEFTIFSGPKTLQDRIIYYRTGQALKVPLTVDTASIAFQFAAKGPNGEEAIESFKLDLISPKDLRGYQGRWITTDFTGKEIQTVFTLCSVYR